MKTYFVFHWVGYEGEDPLHNLEGKIVVRLIDTEDGYDRTKYRAMQIVEKKFWMCGEIVEFKK
jgi:hypothetical protein